MNKKHPKQTPEEETTADYYKLKTRAVDDLVEANEGNAPEVSPEERKRYGAKVAAGVPAWIKVHLIKIWFAGAVCYFIFWGLGMYVAPLDLMVIAGVVLGMVTDILTNNVLRFFAETEGAYDRWMMFPKKRFATFFWNILYAALLLAMVVGIYTGINLALVGFLKPPEGTVPLGVEPVLFGVFYALCDALLIALKHFLARLLTGAAKKNV